jgi:hypothetical protein
MRYGCLPALPLRLCLPKRRVDSFSWCGDPAVARQVSPLLSHTGSRRGQKVWFTALLQVRSCISVLKPLLGLLTPWAGLTDLPSAHARLMPRPEGIALAIFDLAKLLPCQG